MEFDFLYKLDSAVECELCSSGTNLGIRLRGKELTICYNCLSNVYRSIQKKADYLEFKADQFECKLDINNHRTNTYFL